MPAIFITAHAPVSTAARPGRAQMAEQCRRREPAGARSVVRTLAAFSLDDHLALPDWAARQLRAHKRGAVPAELRPMLEPLASETAAEVGDPLEDGKGSPDQ